ncbi:hypothetical protein ERJ75_000753800 [Trypanosoma vivax]|uniref:Uncharacterized protein n=1 Tax=Trypanosoma vivax (strain Y486) TaxID=1055687 RepID=G0U037_TRYVY|nr:hypothetical protein TRVL_05819 [Trypanosoma vivax]KAH8613862.1 hypothetical protein ERJ75_000753800 [Trypanosoma vivax]CCC49434.1 conserved hypothetical protein [Trypanosoma vivax Y486]
MKLNSSGVDYELLFQRTEEDNEELRLLESDIQQRCAVVDDDDEDDDADLQRAMQPEINTQSIAGSGSGASVANMAALYATESPRQEQEPSDAEGGASVQKGVSLISGAGKGDSKSISSTRSRSGMQLSPSDPPAPAEKCTVVSQMAPVAVSTGTLVYAMPGSVSGDAKAQVATPNETKQRSLPVYAHQEDCPPPYEWAGNQTKHPQVGVTGSQRVQLSAQPIPHTSPAVQSHAQLAGSVYQNNRQVMSASVFPPTIQAQQTVVHQIPQPQPPQIQGIASSVGPSINVGQVPPSFPQPQLPPSAQSSAPQPQQHLAAGVQPGYVQLLVPVRGLNGSTNYQLAMMPAQQLPQGSAALSARVQERREPLPQQNVQPQQVMQCVWDHQLQSLKSRQVTQALQIVAPQYASIPGQPQRYAIVPPPGQQGVMAICMNQVQQQPNQARPVFFANQQQPVFATPVPLGCHFN